MSNPIEEDKDMILIKLLEETVWIYKTNVAMELAIEENGKKEEKTNEELVPEEFQDYLDIFSEEKAHCYNLKPLSDRSLYLCLVLGKLSIVYSYLLGSRFNLSSPRVPLVGGIVLNVWEQSSAVNKLSSSYRTLLVTTGLYT